MWCPADKARIQCRWQHAAGGNPRCSTRHSTPMHSSSQLSWINFRVSRVGSVLAPSCFQPTGTYSTAQGFLQGSNLPDCTQIRRDLRRSGEKRIGMVNTDTNTALRFSQNVQCIGIDLYGLKVTTLASSVISPCVHSHHSKQYTRVTLMDTAVWIRCKCDYALRIFG